MQIANNLFVLRTLALFVVLTMLGSISAAQESTKLPDLDWEKGIAGTWDYNQLDTRELWKTTSLGSIGIDRYAPPIAPVRIVFADGKVSFSGLPPRATYELKTAKDENRSLTFELTQDGKSTVMQFTVVDIDTVLLSMPISVLGPVDLVYKRKPEKPTMPRQLQHFAGEWELAPEFTRALWRKLVPAYSHGQYVEETEKELANYKTLRFNKDEIHFDVEQTVEAIKVLEDDGSTIKLTAKYYYPRKPIFAIQPLSDDVIQITDVRRRLVAVYIRQGALDRDGQVPAMRFRECALAESFLAFYAGVESRKNPKKKPRPPRVDGDVELETIAVKKVQTLRGAVLEGSASTYSEISLFVNLHSTRTTHGGFMLRLKRLGEIEDATGKILLSKKRRERIKILTEPRRANSFRNKPDGRSGIVTSFDIESRVDRKTKIKEISGELEIAEYGERMIKFPNLPQQLGKPLDHVLLEGFEIVPNIGDRKTELKLKMTKETKGRVFRCFIVDKTGSRIRAMGNGSGGGEYSYSYAELPENFDLWMSVMKTRKVSNFPFKFENVW